MFKFADIIIWFSSNWKEFVSAIWLPLLTFVLGWIGKKIYDTKLRSPVRMYFLIPNKVKYKLNYVEQDEKEEHLVKELVLPSNSESQVLIWFKPRMNYYEDSIYFGCEDDLNKKPWVIKFSSPFILEENLQKNYFRDWHQHYHLITEKNRIIDEVYVSGFIVKTFEEGEYEAKVLLHTLNRLGRAKLKIKVRNAPSEEVLCVSYKEEKIRDRLFGKYKKEGNIWDKLFNKANVKLHKKHYIKFIVC